MGGDERPHLAVNCRDASDCIDARAVLSPRIDEGNMRLEANDERYRLGDVRRVANDLNTWLACEAPHKGLTRRAMIIQKEQPETDGVELVRRHIGMLPPPARAVTGQKAHKAEGGWPEHRPGRGALSRPAWQLTRESIRHMIVGGTAFAGHSRSTAGGSACL